jgi:hypothetical protein
MLVTFAAVLVVRLTADPTNTLAETYSPTCPDTALPPAVVPTIPCPSVSDPAEENAARSVAPSSL